MSFQGKKNIYLCDGCGHGVITVDVDHGTTPFMTNCQQTGCTGMMQSMMYACPQEILERLPAAMEWYRPTAAALDGKSAHVKEHVERGGLLLRPARPPLPNVKNARKGLRP